MEYKGHYSVLKDECIALLTPPDGEGLWIDGTLGEGGHALAALQANPRMRLAGVDADPVMLARAKKRLQPCQERACFFNAFFDDFFAAYPKGLPNPAAVLLDLGISMFHFEASQRGFSFRKDEALDMRLQPIGQSAAELVASLKEEKLADIFWRYGEERYSRRIAAAIAKERANGPIVKAGQLADIIKRAVPFSPKSRIHPATKSFQALRIAVNDELGRLERVLPLAFARLNAGGRLGIISFHSLEDRMVKQAFRELVKACRCPPEAPVCRCGGPEARLIEPKGVAPSAEEVAENPASRSARLRVLEKLPNRRQTGLANSWK